ncbi:MAG: hypothetical protein U0168_09050 [Nannocystaceae bacterium]
MQSFKTHLTTSESLGRTQIAHHAIGLDMIALFLLQLRQRAGTVLN